MISIDLHHKGTKNTEHEPKFLWIDLRVLCAFVVK